MLKDLAGRGPSRTKTYIHEDCIVVLMREGHTTSEGTMSEGGAERAVAQSRVDLSELIRGPLTEVIERNTGRGVIGFMSSSQQEPDLISYIFVLDTSPLVARIDGDG